MVSFRSLRIAVLGPGIGQGESPGTRKRRQIRDALLEDGHAPFYPEDLISNTSPIDPLLEQERRILSDPEVELVVILHTTSSFGVLAEIANFVSVPQIKAKTVVLFPAQFYTPDESLVANTVRDYLTKMPYTERHFEVCQLVSECRKWANDRVIGLRPDLVSFRF